MGKGKGVGWSAQDARPCIHVHKVMAATGRKAMHPCPGSHGCHRTQGHASMSRKSWQPTARFLAATRTCFSSLSPSHPPPTSTLSHSSSAHHPHSPPLPPQGSRVHRLPCVWRGVRGPQVTGGAVCGEDAQGLHRLPRRDDLQEPAPPADRHLHAALQVRRMGEREANNLLRAQASACTGEYVTESE